MEHTKFPWIIAEQDKRFVYALNDKGYNRFSFLVQGDSETPVEELEANTQFIVKACNAHEELVEALKDAQKKLISILDNPKSKSNEGRLMHTLSHVSRVLATLED